MPSLVGSTVSHYKILSKLGEGGMGVVYKAHDTELDRTVALKFLPHGLTAEESEQARFMHEAKAASALNHPNICTIHTLGEHDGERFIDMEFVDGKTLREIVPVKKMQDAITYAIQIAEALQEAHTHGIVHRDIKAENIMVNSKNQVKVMDFGLAKLKGSLKLTKTSSTIGTLAYMAPEQIQGEEVDARSDIFSFGIVLYEMLTGHLPFRGEHEAAMVYSIVNEDPEPLQHYVPDAPSELLHILDRALEKDREDRYQTVHDMLIDLRRLKKDSSRVSRAAAASTLSEGPVTSSGRSSDGRVRKMGLLQTRTKVVGVIVVGMMALAGVSYFLIFRPTARFVPNRVAVAVFENRTGESSLDGLGTLITESVAQGLAGVGAVEVVPSDDAIRIWQRLKSGSQRTDLLPSFGEETKARLIVSGAYYRQGDSLYFHARVMDSETGKNLRVMQPIGSMLEKKMLAVDPVPRTSTPGRRPVVSSYTCATISSAFSRITSPSRPAGPTRIASRSRNGPSARARSTKKKKKEREPESASREAHRCSCVQVVQQTCLRAACGRPAGPRWSRPRMLLPLTTRKPALIGGGGFERHRGDAVDPQLLEPVRALAVVPRRVRLDPPGRRPRTAPTAGPAADRRAPTAPGWGAASQRATRLRAQFVPGRVQQLHRMALLEQVDGPWPAPLPPRRLRSA